jgi:hypothetical protein
VVISHKVADYGLDLNLVRHSYLLSNDSSSNFVSNSPASQQFVYVSFVVMLFRINLYIFQKRHSYLESKDSSKFVSNKRTHVDSTKKKKKLKSSLTAGKKI